MTCTLVEFRPPPGEIQESDVNVGHCHSSWTPVFPIDVMDFGVNALRKVQVGQSQLLAPKI